MYRKNLNTNRELLCSEKIINENIDSSIIKVRSKSMNHCAVSGSAKNGHRIKPPLVVPIGIPIKNFRLAHFKETGCDSYLSTDRQGSRLPKPATHYNKPLVMRDTLETYGGN